LPAATSLWNEPIPPVLASASQTRRALLEAAGLPVAAVPAAVDERRLEEDFLAGGGDPARVAVLLARAKALEVSGRRPAALCIGADQTLLIEGALMHKPEDLAAAARALRRLAGRAHALIAAVCVARDGAILFEAADRARLTMRALDDATISRYCATGGPALLSSVGAYQIEGIGIHLFEAVEGAHATILGMPLLPLLKWLRREGFIVL
jgi:septum formation protein